jgi:chromosome segregation ATPase
MSQKDGSGSPDDIEGRSLDDAVSVVAESTDEDPDDVRSVLYHVSTDGVVTRDAVDESLAHLSKVVSTAESRTEFAEIALEDAREAAEPVADLDVVRARLDAFESELSDIQDRAAALSEQLGGLVDGTDRELYALATGMHDLTAAANRVQMAADELQMDLESFERWLSNPSTRLDDLAADLDALETSLDRLTDAADGLVDADDAAAAWADATVSHRVTSLLLADVRAELADLRSWADRDELDVEDRTADLAARLDALETRWERTGDRLEEVARSGWRDRFDDRLSALDADLDTFEPPVRWERVEAVVEDYRDTIDNTP